MTRWFPFLRLNLFQKLRLQFIAIATGAVSIILISVFGVMAVIVNNQSNHQIERILSILSDNKGQFPNLNDASRVLGQYITEETIERYAYFSAIVDEDGQISSVDASHLTNTDSQTVERYSQRIVKASKEEGQIILSGLPYAYRITPNANQKGASLLVAFDISTFASTSYHLLDTAVWFGFICLFFFMVVIIVLSGRVIRPFIRNYEQQRRFITNAGHELKTPLAIIAANNELVELMSGESEWTKSTKDQVERLTGLINSLVMQARLEEQSELVLKTLDFSRIAQDAAEDFKGPVIRDGKQFIMDIQEGIFVKAEEKSLFELVTLLVDNANKYCDEGGVVSVTLSQPKRSRRCRLIVSNTYVNGRGVDYSRFFERFYREDSSHNSATSGYGIGLSIAESLVKLFRGRIKVTYKDDTIHFIVFL
ncbi:sensor histidine kinase [Streptococcus sp. zg-JUN1979]|uniref:sensor histidine kinase n=1 Tax=Streptococcus sp. zg-JUN1979 TaxID=3391450 RepID=UPI0039A48E37